MDNIKDLPPLYYINLDERVDKNSYMEKLLETYNIKGHRISAINGKLDNSSLLYHQIIPPRLRPTEIRVSLPFI